MSANKILSLITLLLVGSFAQAQVETFNFDGVLTDASDVPMSGPVTLLLKVYDPSESCLLFEETHSSVPLDAQGRFSVKVGNGTRSDGNSWNLFESFGHQFTFTGPSCTSYTALPTDNRKLVVTVNGTALSPAYVLSRAPFAGESSSVGGFKANSLLRVENGGVPGAATSMTTSDFTELTNLIGGTSSLYEKPGQINGSTLPALSAGQGVRWNGAAWEAYTPAAGGAVASVSATAPLSVGGTAAAPIVQLDDSGVTSGTYGTASDVPVISVSTKGVINSVSTMPITITRSQISDLASSPDFVKKVGDTMTGSLTLPTLNLSPTPAPGGPTAGSIFVDSGDGNKLKWYDGAMWKSPGEGDFRSDGSMPMSGNIDLGGNWLSGDGSPQGIYVDSGSGRVGVGTNAPTSFLQVSNPSGQSDVLVETPSATYGAIVRFKQVATQGHVGFQPSSNGLHVKTISSVPVIFSTQNTEAMRITPTGEVGIGTMSPQATLHVGGDIVGGYLDNSAATTIDWSEGNVQTANSCASFTFNNMVDGGVYRLIILDTTTPTSCVFNDGGGRTVRYKMGAANWGANAGTLPSQAIFTVVTGNVLVEAISYNP